MGESTEKIIEQEIEVSKEFKQLLDNGNVTYYPDKTEYELPFTYTRTDNDKWSVRVKQKEVIEFKVLPSIAAVLREKFVGNKIPVYQNKNATRCWYSAIPWKLHNADEEHTTIYAVVLDVVTLNYDKCEYILLVEINGEHWAINYPEEQ